MKGLSNYLLEVPLSNISTVQEGQLVLGHILWGLLDFKKAS